MRNNKMNVYDIFGGKKHANEWVLLDSFSSRNLKNEYCVLYINIYYIGQLWFSLNLLFYIWSMNIGFSIMHFLCVIDIVRKVKRLCKCLRVCCSALNFFNKSWHMPTLNALGNERAWQHTYNWQVCWQARACSFEKKEWFLSFYFIHLLLFIIQI